MANKSRFAVLSDVQVIGIAVSAVVACAASGVIGYQFGRVSGWRSASFPVSVAEEYLAVTDHLTGVTTQIPVPRQFTPLAVGPTEGSLPAAGLYSGQVIPGG